MPIARVRIHETTIYEVEFEHEPDMEPEEIEARGETLFCDMPNPNQAFVSIDERTTEVV